jgi:indole-3-glycerol phosphate synthase
MSFRLENMKTIKSGEISRMKALSEKIKVRNRDHYYIQDTLCDKINIIAELKHSSPSAGSLSGDLSDSEIVNKYISGGASAISVLTETEYFGGSYEHLKAVSSSCEKPVLCKDFIYYEDQIEAAYLCGADMVLLISRMLDKDTINRLYNKIKSYNMTPLVEIHEKREIENIMFLNPGPILVNMRNLETLEMNFKTGIETLKMLPSSVTPISASGIESIEDIRYIMNETGTNSFLVGSSLMKSGNPERTLMEFKNVY